MKSNTTQGTALITGSSTGIGAIYADRLAKRGYDLILVARNESRLQSVAAKIRSETGRNVRVLPADLNDNSALARVEETLRTDPTITLLVNNAGIGAVAPLLQTDVKLADDMIALNIRALTRLTYAAVPAFVALARGTIINIASVVGIAPEVLNGVYGASKAYVLALTQSLQHELAPSGIRVQAVLPGATETEFWDIAGHPVSNLPQNIVMSAADLVDAALAGLDQGEVVTIPPLQDGDVWTTYEAQRKAMGQQFGHSKPGARYAKA